MARSAVFLIAPSLLANAAPPEPAPIAPGETTHAEEPSSPFVGRYNGSSFETAMGMEVLEDGT